MDKTILCLSYLNGRLKAQAVSRRAVLGQWERTELVEGFDDFGDVVKAAVRNTGFRGSQAGLVLAHPRLTNQLLETPPVKGWALDRFIQRRAAQLKPFDSEAVVSYQQVAQVKQGNAVLLHLLPKPLLDQICGGFEEAGLHLVEVFPITSVLAGQLAQLPLEENDIALLAAETEGTTTVIIGRKNGEVLFGRSLNSSWNSNRDRVMVDLHRTMLFVEQQFGRAVGSLWLYGAGAAEHAQAMEPMVKVPAKVSPVPRSPFYWIFQGQKLPTGDTNNLIGSEMRKAPQRRFMLRTTAMIVGVFMLLSLLTTAYIEVLVRKQRKALSDLEPQIVELNALKSGWEQKFQSLGQQQEWIKVVLEKDAPPVPGWFLSYLGEIFPEELVLTHLEVKRVEDFWAVQLGGTVQPVEDQSPAQVLAKGVGKLTSSLANGPFRLTIHGKGANGDSLRTAKGSPGAARLANGSANGSASGTQFFIEGSMR